MWTCKKCREESEDDYLVCWNCGTDCDGNADPGFEVADAPIEEPLTGKPVIKKSVDVSQRHLKEPIVIGNLNQAGGMLVPPFLLSCLCFSGFAYIFLHEHPNGNDERFGLLCLSGVFLLVFLGMFARAAYLAVLRITIGDYLTARKLSGSTEYELKDIQRITFEDDLENWIRVLPFVYVTLGSYRLVTFFMSNGTYLRVHVDSKLENKIRELCDMR